MKAYKGFDKNLQCRGFQYEIGKEYETDRAELCEAGFHACKSPLKVWDFYPPIDGNRFCEVEQSGGVKSDGDGKSVSTRLKVGAEIGIPGLVKAHIEWCKEQTKEALEEPVTTDGGSYYAQIGSSGDYAKIGSSGDYAKIGSSGYSAKIGSSGDYAKIKCDGENAVVACAGEGTIVNAPVGTWVCLSEYDIRDGKRVCIGMKAFRIDGKKYKAGVWLGLKNGNVVEVKL